MIADPRREIYSRYRIEKSPWAIFSPRAWPDLVKGYRLKRAGEIDSTTFGLPADFLIDHTGRIVRCAYGAHSSDQWSVDYLITLTRGERSSEQDHAQSWRQPSSEG